jgi:TrmH family RNA methyltransferase
VRYVVLVEPEVPENTGFIARLCANFESELRIVNPDFNLSKAQKTASRAQEKLREAKISDKVEEAVEDLEFVVGTKPGKGETVKNFEAWENTSLMIGRESSGLTNQELELCDTVVHIETADYSSLNQSHAAAIMMHKFHISDEENFGMTSSQKEKLDEIIQTPELKDIVKKANPTREEVNSLIGQIKRTENSK